MRARSSSVYAQRATSIQPRSTGAWRCWRSNGDLAAGAAALHRSDARAARRPRRLFYLAHIAEAQGDKDAALAVYRRLMIPRWRSGAHSAAAGLLLETDKRAEAFALLDDYADDASGGAL